MLKIKKHIVLKFYLKDDGRFPNNKTLPVLLYRHALKLPSFFAANYVTKLFKNNNWTNSWKAGIFDYQHYHSVTHEVLGVYRGSTTILLGGTKGIKIVLEAGDVLVIPAGVAHKNVTPEKIFKCVGAYPEGMEYDIMYGKVEERPKADKNIKNVPLPLTDPVDGEHGPIKRCWKIDLLVVSV